MSVKQGIRIKYAKNKNAKYYARSTKYTYTKTNKNTTTRKYSYTKRILVNGKYRYYYN